MIKLSIIVPVYNVENYIEECLNSLVNQTLKELEIIVVNDGSTDNSQKIIDKYVKKYPDLIKSFIKENGGQSTARNFGLKQICGKYVGFIDSDDFVDKNFAQKMYEEAEKNNSDVVVCDMVEIYQNKKKYLDCTTFNYIYENSLSVCNKIFKSDLFNNIKFIDNKMWYEDLNIMLKLYPNLNKISVIHKGYYYCNCRNNSTMRNNNSLKNLDIIVAIEDAKEYLKKVNKFDEELYKYIVFDHVLIEAINRVQLHKNNDKKKVIKNLYKYCNANISDFKKMNFYKEVSLNRRIVANLNYYGLSIISRLLINLKSKISNRSNNK